MNDHQQRLQELGIKVRDFQVHRGLTPKELVREYSMLGSVDTLRRVLEGDWENVNAERWVPHFEAAYGLMELAMAEEEVSRSLFEDTDNVRSAVAAVTGAFREKSIARVVVITGEYGRGKTSICNIIEQKWPNITLRMNYRSSWGDSEFNFVGQLLAAAKIRERKVAGEEGKEHRGEAFWDKARREQELFEYFDRRRLILIIDEAHHLGPNTINLLKALINETELVLVLGAIPKLLKKLETYAYQEAKQLFTNRLYDRVRLAAPNAAECREFLERRQTTFADAKTAEACCKSLATAAADPNKDGLHYLQKFCQRSRRVTGGKALTAEMFAKVNTRLEQMYRTEIQ